MSSWGRNRKLLVSVFNAQEAREAILGGGRIIDSEDPKSALGNIKPRHIMAVSDAALDFKRDNEVQLSTNIGEDQLLFRRSDTGDAVEKSPYEIAGKAAQAAIGVATAMGTRVHPASIVKVGLDGMRVPMLAETLVEVVQTLERTEHLSHTQVMSVLFVQDLEEWARRKREAAVQRLLVELREFSPAGHAATPDAIDLLLDDAAVGTLRDRDGKVLFRDRTQLSLAALVRAGVLPAGSDDARVVLNDLFPHAVYFPGLADGARTSLAIIKAMVDVTADSGAHGIMLDTSILSKVCDICLVDTSRSEMVDLNPLYGKGRLQRRGILNLEEIRFFVDYCHYKGIVANVAGSLDSYQAQMLWVLVPELDQLSTRGSASGVVEDPSRPGSSAPDTRQHRAIRRSLVRGLAPPEHGGVLNLPIRLRTDPSARDLIRSLRELIAERRRAQGLPELQTYWVDSAGAAELEGGARE